MKYVNRFLKQKEMPEDLRTKIVRYLEYNWELKKQYKIEESEVFSMLNTNLRDKITVQINGRILHRVIIFDNFPLDFLAKITFLFKKRSYIVDDAIFNVISIFISFNLGRRLWKRNFLHLQWKSFPHA